MAAKTTKKTLNTIRIYLNFKRLLLNITRIGVTQIEVIRIYPYTPQISGQLQNHLKYDSLNKRKKQAGKRILSALKEEGEALERHETRGPAGRGQTHSWSHGTADKEFPR
jgi:hypothetical protein